MKMEKELNNFSLLCVIVVVVRILSETNLKYGESSDDIKWEIMDNKKDI